MIDAHILKPLEFLIFWSLMVKYDVMLNNEWCYFYSIHYTI